MRVLGIDCGGSHLSCALVENKEILAHTSIETDASSFREMLPVLASTLRELCRKCTVPVQSCSGLGIGLPVILETLTGEILSTFKFCDLPEIDLAAWSERELGLPIRFENDARMALLGEQFAGAAMGAEDVVMITLGTGIGGAAMLQGRLLHSRYGQAGCLGGHLTVNFQGRKCKCGAIGCAEAEASTWALEGICREWPGFCTSSLTNDDTLNFDTLFRAKDEGDTVAREVLQHCLEVWSALTVSLIHAYGPELILFGGAVMRRGEEVLEPIRRFAGTHLWRTTRGLPRIEAATLGSNAALFGAEALFKELSA
jgi:glucokinase